MENVEPAQTVETPSTPPAAPPAPSAAPAKTEDEALSEIYREAMASDDDKPAEPVPEKQARDPKTQRFVAKDAPKKEGDDAEVTEETAKAKDDDPEAKDAPKEAEKKADEGEKEEKAADDAAEEVPIIKEFSRKQQEQFAALDKKGRDFALNMRRQLIGQHSEATKQAQEYQRVTEPVMKMMTGHSDYLRQTAAQLTKALGREVSPVDIVGNIVRTESKLRTGTFAEKAAILQQMATDYGVPMQLIDDPMADPTQPGSQEYAVIHDLRQQIANLQAKLDGQTETHQASLRDQEHQRAVSQIEAFRNAKNDDGELLHPHFDDVRDAMQELIASGEVTTLQAAYRLATMEHRARLDAEKARLKQAAADAAKRAGRVNVQSAPVETRHFDNEDDMLRSTYRQAISA